MLTQKDTRKLHYAVAGVSFLVPLIVYLVTMQPTVPFWDCGEFAAAAWALQVPHPPGAPLWTLVGRLGMMISLFADPVVRYNVLSVVSSALTVMILYLTVVRLSRIWRGEARSVADAVVQYGGGLLAALAFTFTDSFWFNAVECEVYAFGSLFIALIPWLLLVWYDHADEAHSERYLLLIAYVIGLSMGVHQLALLTLFPVFMLVYYRKWHSVTVKGWVTMAIAAVAAFLIAYKLVLSQLIAWMGSGAWPLSTLLIAGILFGIYWSTRNEKPVWNLAMWSAMLLFLGYTTYTTVLIRAEENPPMNQNAPSTFAKLTKYINRDQYGESSLFPRRIESQREGHEATWNDYTSDLDFFLKYQTNHMFNRYLAWNFVGRADAEQGAGSDFSKTWALPLLIGLFGLYWHFKRDPKRALAFLAMFILLGWMTAWYQNQQEPQPRERDYFYVGAFYVYAMWIGLGATGLLEFVSRRRIHEGASTESHTETSAIAVGDDVYSGREVTLAATMVGLVVLVPLNMCLGLAGLVSGQTFEQSSKWEMYSRHGNYVPFDYAYNILQSCDQDAILFTYGDNDTFPIWCLQDVYGIRRDVRVVQLMLSNMFWYVDQLRRPTEWGAKPVALPGLDRMLDFGTEDEAAYRTVDWTTRDMRVALRGDSTDVLAWRFEPRVLSDQVVAEVVASNVGTRPIYFSVTVPEPSQAGLTSNLIYEGMTRRVVADRQMADPSGFAGSLNVAKFIPVAYNQVADPLKTPDRGMLLRTYADPAARRSPLDDRYALSYRMLYIRLANHFIVKDKPAEAKKALETLDARIPSRTVPMDYIAATMLGTVYSALNEMPQAERFFKMARSGIEKTMAERSTRGADPYSEGGMLEFTYADILMRVGELELAREKFESVRSQVDPAARAYINLKLKEVRARELDRAGQKNAALVEYLDVLAAYGPSANVLDGMEDLRNRVARLREEVDPTTVLIMDSTGGLSPALGQQR